MATVRSGILKCFLDDCRETESSEEGKIHDFIVDRVKEVHEELFQPNIMRNMDEFDCSFILTQGIEDGARSKIVHKGSKKVFHFIRRCLTTPHEIDMRELKFNFYAVERVIDHMRFLRLYKLGLVPYAPDKEALFPGDGHYTEKEMNDFLEFFNIELDVY